MDYSFVIPAYNEEQRIARCIESIQASMKALEKEYEIIASDDDSTDQTAVIAEQCGATVVRSGKRNIGATRNVGAAAAQGEVIVFVDADSIVQPQTLIEMDEALDNGAIGGGAPITWTSRANLMANLCLVFWNTVSKLFCLPAGSFFFVKQEAFVEAGGFDESFYATEELHLGKALKQIGRLAIVKAPIQTSPRKVHEFSHWEIIKLLATISISPNQTLKNRERLDVWYERRGRSSH